MKTIEKYINNYKTHGYKYGILYSGNYVKSYSEGTNLWNTFDGYSFYYNSNSFGLDFDKGAKKLSFYL